MLDTNKYINEMHQDVISRIGEAASCKLSVSINSPAYQDCCKEMDYLSVIELYLQLLLADIPVASFYNQKERIQFHKQELQCIYDTFDLDSSDSDLKEKVVWHIQHLKELNA
jgi:hypothetical protein